MSVSNRSVTNAEEKASPLAAQFILEHQKDGDFAFAHVKTRRYLQANGGGELSTWAGASAFVKTKVVKKVTAKPCLWNFFPAPRSVQQVSCPIT